MSVVAASWATVALLPAAAGAAPAAPVKLELEQPSGRAFEARQFGDEWYHGYESLSGYTILREPKTDVWRYAEPTADGVLEPEGPRATAPPPPDADKHLRDESLQQRAETRILRSQSATSDPPRSPSPANLGGQPVLVILAEFNDRNSQTSAASWRSGFFGETNSVRSYWSAASYGNLDLGPATESYGTADDGVVGWVRLNRNHPQGNDMAEKQTVRDAIIAADPYVNYAGYDDNGNGKIAADELHVVVIPAGYEQAACGADTPYSVWGHRGSTFGYTPTVDGKEVGGAGGDVDGSYAMFGETQCDETGGTWRATIGIMVHELGHDLDLPDLYSSADQTDGIGAWSVMAGGTWLQTGTQHAGETPSLPDAWSKYYQGWTTPQQRSGTRVLGTAATTPDVMRLGDNAGGVDWSFNVQSGAGEYFLVENRQQTGFDSGLPGCGLVVWHVDETRTSTNAANAVGSRRLVDLEEADNNNNPWQSGDAFRSRSFNGSTVPNSNFYSGAASNLGVEGINGCGTTMGGNFLQVGQLSPDHDLLSNSIELTGAQGSRSGQTAGADREAGEPNHAGVGRGKSVWYRWTAPRTGQVTFDTMGSNFDTVLGVYTGARVNGLNEIAANDDAGGVRQSRVSFNASAGTTYRIAVDAYASASPDTGSVSLQWDQPIPKPANDDFAAATTVNTDNLLLTGDTNEGATKEAGEPNHAGNAGGGSVWYRWTASGSGRVAIDTSGSSFDTVLAAYTGGAVNGLTERAFDDDAGTGSASLLDFPVTAGTTYRIAIDGFNNARGTIQLRLTYTDPPPNTTLTGTPDGSPTSTNASFSFSSSGAATGFECSLDGAAWSGCTSPKSYTGLAVGQHNFAVRAVGPGGPDPSPSSFNWRIDAPLQPAPNTSITSAPEATTTDTDASFSFAAEGEATGFECRLDAGGWSGCTSPKTFSGLTVGGHQFSVRATGPGGADPTPAIHEWMVEAAAPLPPDTSIESGPLSRTTARSASFGFAAEGEATGFECRLDAGGWSGCTSPKTFSDLSIGAHRFSVRAMGPGGPDPTPESHDWTIVAPPPPPPPDEAPETEILSGPPETNVVRRKLRAEFTFTASEPATFSCRIDDQAWAPCRSPLEIELKARRKKREFVFAVRATDRAGQTDPTPAEYTFSLKRKKAKRGQRS